MKVVAVVVARAGSRRLPGKALLPFGESTLLGSKVQSLRACAAVDRVIVGSDSAAIRAEGERHGAEAMIRDAYHCDEAVCDARGMIADVADKLLRGFGVERGDLVLWAHPTNPLVKPGTYAHAIESYLAHVGEIDSVVSVHAERRHAWWDSAGTGGARPLNFNPAAVRHQVAGELAAVRFQCGSIFLQPLGMMLANSYFYGSWPYLFEMPGHEWWDVDDRTDYEIARTLWELEAR